MHWDKELQHGKQHYKLGKPELCIELLPTTTLPDLVGPYSFLLWDILGLDWEWLWQSHDSWEESDSYQEMSEYVRTVKVTNDCAERGIKVGNLKC